MSMTSHCNPAGHCVHCGKPIHYTDKYCEACGKANGGWRETTHEQCGNCHAHLEPDDKYCRQCGTKVGEGAYEPYQDLMQCIYGPMPVNRKHICKLCGNEWMTCSMIDSEKHCPVCGAMTLDDSSIASIILHTEHNPNYFRRAKTLSEGTYKEILNETLDILSKRSYHTQQGVVNLKLSYSQMVAAKVFLPEDVRSVCDGVKFSLPTKKEKCEISCENADSFSLAIKRYSDFNILFAEEDSKKILVLNMANPIRPGGGVRRGAKAQEEDLCRRSSLLFSLETERAWKYYEYNRALNTDMGSDGMILSPEVEIFRDENGELLPETSIVSVLTCAAPIYKSGLYGMSMEEYQEVFYQRILGMLKCAAVWGYRVLILGAWGCGAFGNDAKMVSGLFYRALKNLKVDGVPASKIFAHIDFAILDKTTNLYNFTEFSKTFAPNRGQHKFFGMMEKLKGGGRDLT